MHGIDSARRNWPAEQSLAVWQKMLIGNDDGRQYCMRFKINMQDPNKAMRDPVAYRCNLTPHWRTSSQYKVHISYSLYIDVVQKVFKLRADKAPGRHWSQRGACISFAIV